MLVLAVESSGELSAVAVADESGVLAASAPVRGRRHGESVAPAIERVCTEAKRSLGQLGAVVVDVGPGLFTGLRVGVSTAKSLGFALGIPVVEVGSLELLAASAANWLPSAPGGDVALIVPVVDARRAQVFSARFEPLSGPGSSEAEQVQDARLFDPEALADELHELVAGGAGCLCLGDGALRYRRLLERAGAEMAPQALCDPDVGLLARIGLSRALAGRGRPAGEVAARYLRPADVRINWEQRIGARASAGA